MKIIGITIETFCENPKCGKTFRVTTSEIKCGQHTCDCDYPCDCKNGPYKFIEAECPECGRTEPVIISEIKE